MNFSDRSVWLDSIDAKGEIKWPATVGFNMVYSWQASFQLQPLEILFYLSFGTFVLCKQHSMEICWGADRRTLDLQNLLRLLNPIKIDFCLLYDDSFVGNCCNFIVKNLQIRQQNKILIRSFQKNSYFYLVCS